MNKTWMFVVSLIGMALPAAALILLVPSLFGSAEQSSVWAAGTLACLVAIFAMGTRYWRPARPTPKGN